MKKLLAFIISAVMILYPLQNAYAISDTKAEKSEYPILEKFLKTLTKDDGKNADRIIRVIVETEKDMIKEVKKKVSKIDSVEIKFEYKNVLEGFSFNIKHKYLDKLKDIEGIKNIKKSEVLEPQMFNAKELTDVVKAKENFANKYNMDGRGLLIASIDSGVDINNPNLRLDENDEDVMAKRKIKDIKPPFTNKVPFAYSYFKGDENTIDEVQRPHGMHIAGILAGNSEDPNGFKGIAPNAQLLVYKVFTDNRKGGQSDIQDSDIEYVAEDAAFHAMDDAVARGADIISLSIGDRGTGRSDDIWHNALKNATDKGVVVVAAMGNYAASNSTTSNEIFADNGFDLKDNGTAVSVAANPLAIGVGSAYNTTVRLPSVMIDGKEYPYEDVSRYNKTTIPTEQISAPMIFVGRGMEEDLAQDDRESQIAGKIVLVKRGGEDIKDKLERLVSKNAVGVILINDAISYSRGNYDNHPVIGFNHLSIMKKWCISVSGDAGKELIAKAGQNSVNLTFDPNRKNTKLRPNTGVSGFSSFGPNFDLEIKPDILAPGEDILSTGNGEQYVSMSGTSMASPHIAGMSALMLQKIKEVNLDIFADSGINKVNLIKIMLMNTAKVLKDTEAIEADGSGFEYSPRRQGAGLANLNDALSTDVVVVSENRGSVALKEIDGKKDFTLKLYNFGTETRKFEIDKSAVLTEAKVTRMRKDGEKDVELKTIHDKNIVGASLDISREVIIPAGSMVEVEATLNPGDAQDEFVEGYIYFKSKSVGQPDLNIPYLAFKGKWDKEPILDKPAWEDGSITKLVSLIKKEGHDKDDEKFIELGKMTEDDQVDPNRFAMTNKSKGNTRVFELFPRLLFLRDAYKYKVEVVDQDNEDANVVRLVNTGYFPRKYMDNPFKEDSWYYDQYVLPDLLSSWNGKVYDEDTGSDDKEAPEGKYFFRIGVQLRENDEYQNTYIPFRIDNTSPTMNVTIDKENDKAVIRTGDNVGIWHVGATIDRKSVPVEKVSENLYEIRGLSINAMTSSKLRIEAMDFAGNPAKEFEQNLNNGNITFANLDDVADGSSQEINMSLKDNNNSLRATFEDRQLNIEKSDDGVLKLSTADIGSGNHVIKFEVLDSEGQVIDIARVKVKVHSHSIRHTTDNEDEDLPPEDEDLPPDEEEPTQGDEDEDVGNTDDEDDEDEDDEEDDWESSVFDKYQDIEIKNGIVLNSNNIHGKNFLGRDDIETVENENEETVGAYYKIWITLKKGYRADFKVINPYYNKQNNIEGFTPRAEEKLPTATEKVNKMVKLPVTDGDNRINIKVYDTRGEEERLVFNHGYMLYLDLQRPTIKLDDSNISYIDGRTVDENETIGYLYTSEPNKARLRGSIKENLDSWSLAINGDLVERSGLVGHLGLNEKSFDKEFKTSDGKYVYVKIKDASDNIREFTLRVKVDSQAPTVNISPEESLDENSVLDIDVSDDMIEPEEIAVSRTVNGQDYIDGTPLKNYELADDAGKYYINVTAIDKAGNKTVKELTVGEIPTIEALPLKQTEFTPKELEDINNLFSVGEGVTVSLLEKVILPDGRIQIKAVFTNRHGRSVEETYTVKVKKSKKKIDKKLKGKLKKSHFMPEELNSIDNVMDLPKDVGVVMDSMIDASTPGEKQITVSFYRAGVKNQETYTIYVLDDLNAELTKNSISKTDLDNPQSFLNLQDGVKATVVDKPNYTIGENVIKILLTDNYGHEKEVSLNVNIVEEKKQDSSLIEDNQDSNLNIIQKGSVPHQLAQKNDMSKKKMAPKSYVSTGDSRQVVGLLIWMALSLVVFINLSVRKKSK